MSVDAEPAEHQQIRAELNAIFSDSEEEEVPVKNVPVADSKDQKKLAVNDEKAASVTAADQKAMAPMPVIAPSKPPITKKMSIKQALFLRVFLSKELKFRMKILGVHPPARSKDSRPSQVKKDEKQNPQQKANVFTSGFGAATNRSTPAAPQPMFGVKRDRPDANRVDAQPKVNFGGFSARPETQKSMPPPQLPATKIFTGSPLGTGEVLPKKKGPRGGPRAKAHAYDKKEKGSISTLIQVLELSGCHFTCDEDQGIQRTKGPKTVGVHEKMRRFHGALREAEKKKVIPERETGQWSWKLEENLNSVFQVMYRTFSTTKFRCSFNIDVGPHGAHACMVGNELPPLFMDYDGDKFQMLHYAPEDRNLFSSELSNCVDMALVIKQAPRARWFFMGGKIPKDFDVLKEALPALGLTDVHIKDGDQYFAAIGIKDYGEYPWMSMEPPWVSGPGRVNILQKLHKTKHKKEMPPLEDRNSLCDNCKMSYFRRVHPKRVCSISPYLKRVEGTIVMDVEDHSTPGTE